MRYLRVGFSKIIILLIAGLSLPALAQSSNKSTAPAPRATAPVVRQPATTVARPQTGAIPANVQQGAEALRQRLISQGVSRKDINKTIDAYYTGMGVSPPRSSPPSNSIPTFSSSFQPVGQQTAPRTIESPTSVGTVPPPTPGRLNFGSTAPNTSTPQTSTSVQSQDTGQRTSVPPAANFPPPSMDIAGTTPKTVPGQLQQSTTGRPQFNPAPIPGTVAANTSVTPSNFRPSAYSLPVPGNSGTQSNFFAKDYADKIGKQHTGVDLPAIAGTNVFSPVNGKIVDYFPNGTKSFVIIQEKGKDVQHVLGHISCDGGCKKGQDVFAGKPFGAKVLDYGTPGSQGDHVHWGAKTGKIPITRDADGFGWGQAPATSTVTQATNKGWFDPLTGSPLNE